jgi:hypothetical protein
VIDKIFDKIAFIGVIIIIFALIFVLAYGLYDFKESRLLYNECITTDYDKFQCYAMIYGGG